MAVHEEGLRAATVAPRVMRGQPAELWFAAKVWSVAVAGSHVDVRPDLGSLSFGVFGDGDWMELTALLDVPVPRHRVLRPELERALDRTAREGVDRRLEDWVLREGHPHHDGCPEVSHPLFGIPPNRAALVTVELVARLPQFALKAPAPDDDFVALAHTAQEFLDELLSHANTTFAPMVGVLLGEEM
ncbi:hypothetical protein [Embleya hyalina]|uniref:hypothetical protein n=1 Tax=Embleya hyalina TaxID=516124 RepID=UPI001C3F661E|nr:hypothetical protein [Embleya hyalina]